MTNGQEFKITITARMLCGVVNITVDPILNPEITTLEILGTLEAAKMQVLNNSAGRGEDKIHDLGKAAFELQAIKKAEHQV